MSSKFSKDYLLVISIINETLSSCFSLISFAKQQLLLLLQILLSLVLFPHSQFVQIFFIFCYDFLVHSHKKGLHHERTKRQSPWAASCLLQKLHNLTQIQLAERADISVRYVSLIETGHIKNYPSIPVWEGFVRF